MSKDKRRAVQNNLINLKQLLRFFCEEDFFLKPADATCTSDEVIATQPGCHEKLQPVSK